MKRALLWLCSLACLTLAGLYAYAWLHRDPLAAAFERIEEGMTFEEAVAIMGRPGDGNYLFISCPGPQYRGDITYWEGKRNRFEIWHYGGRVESTKATFFKETMVDKIRDWACNLASLWAPAPPPVNLPPVKMSVTFAEPPTESRYESIGYPRSAFDAPATQENEP
jgi:hypothetical protein